MFFAWPFYCIISHVLVRMCYVVQILAHFPRIVQIGMAIERRVDKLSKEEKEKRPDIYALAIGYVILHMRFFTLYNICHSAHGIYHSTHSRFCNSWVGALHKVVVTTNCVDVRMWANACDPCECACCATLRHLEPLLPWELRLLKFFIN